MTAEDVIKLLKLEPLTLEGGYFRETYRSTDIISAGALPSRYGLDHSVSTCIYYLITPECTSALHRIATDEIFHFYLGDPVEMVIVHSNDELEKCTLGSDLKTSQVPQKIVPAGLWQGARLFPGGKFALMGTTVSPGFEYSELEIANKHDLESLPKHANYLQEFLSKN